MFEHQKITRQFGEVLVISCLLERRQVTSGIEINQWISTRLHSRKDVLLPSSFIYPLLNSMASEKAPYIQAKEGGYIIHKRIKTKELQESLGQVLTASTEYLERLNDVLLGTNELLGADL
jgi:hypothetical protein